MHGSSNPGCPEGSAARRELVPPYGFHRRPEGHGDGPRLTTSGSCPGLLTMLARVSGHAMAACHRSGVDERGRSRARPTRPVAGGQPAAGAGFALAP